MFLYLKETKDDSLVGLGQNREALLIGEEDAGGKYGCLDWFTEPLIDHLI